ncbi:MAG: hypothetical protein JO026_01415 [Patescibacteria group bacterium]|nr:hypothetical protein [Patescibacteria group bacterium]
MTVNVSVARHGSESSMSLVRRFSKRVLGAGIIRKVKGSRYRLRGESRTKRRNSALRRVAKFEKKEEMERLGLSEPKDPRAGRR